MNNLLRKSGFTIVEVLVVITIIGILASVGIIGFNGSQIRAKDSANAQDAAQLKNLVELRHSRSESYACTGCTTAAQVASTYEAAALVPSRAAFYNMSTILDNDEEGSGTTFDKTKLVLVNDDFGDRWVSVAYWSIAEQHWVVTAFYNANAYGGIRTETTFSEENPWPTDISEPS